MPEEPVLVPEHETGASSDIEHSVTSSNAETAKDLYRIAKQRLLLVNNWNELCGENSAYFTLTDELGDEVVRPAQLGDHIKIRINAPVNETGDGFDWVQVEAIEDKNSEIEDTDIISMRVRPVDNPKDPKKEETAHFFDEAATSTFTVRRDKELVVASVHGRNETPNMEPKGLWEKIRNTVIATGAMLGANRPQWKCLVEGLLKNP